MSLINDGILSSPDGDEVEFETFGGLPLVDYVFKVAREAGDKEFFINMDLGRRARKKLLQ